MLFPQMENMDVFLRTGIPEVKEANTVFDMRAQGALQGVLQVIGHPKAMNFPDDDDWFQVMREMRNTASPLQASELQ